ncbi:MAG: glycosyltransferase family 39 protein [Acidobacteriota bacterium]|nr:glycosyltransferase family 39 protein [Acidobacteriota bacterium]
MSGITNSRPARISDPAGLLFAVLTAAIVSALSIWFFHHTGSTLYFGDAESHLNTARRIVDSRTPGYDQLGSPWLPLPHILMLPFIGNMTLWRTGLAGSIPSGACFIAAAGFLYAATFRIFRSRMAAGSTTAAFVLNPNALYLQSVPMTESAFFCALLGLLYFTVVFEQTRTLAAVAGIGTMALAGTLTRYEGWFLLPFVALFLLLAGSGRRLTSTLLFSVIAALGPLWWFSYNWWYFGSALYFYNGPYSAKAIQGAASYPGKNDWITAARYFFMAAKLVMGTPLFWIGFVGLAAACMRRAFWPVLLLSLPPVFYVWSMHSSGNPIFMPVPPHPYSWYNTRYGLAALPLFAFCSGALASLFPARIAPALVLLAVSPWALQPRKANWITWKESEVNSEARRAWTHQAAAYLRANFRKGDTIFTNFSDITAVYRESGIPLRKTFTGDNGLEWQAAVLRPDLFLRDQWAISTGGDQVEAAAARSSDYKLVRQIEVKDAPAIGIYRR